MPSKRVPSYRRHKASGQAVVTLNGRDFYLGIYNSQESRDEYDRRISEWLVSGRQLPFSELTIAELIAGYFVHVEEYYKKNGKPTGQVPGIRVALRILRQRYGHTQASNFGPLALTSLQEHFIQLGQSRVYANENVARIKRMFRWGVQRELIDAAVYERLKTVPGLKRGRSGARECPPVGPVPKQDVDKTLPFLPLVVQAMVRVQLLTGARPGEICLLRPQDISRDGDVWEYSPEFHKTEHQDRPRTIVIGPRAQTVLRPYLQRSPGDYCFSPQESEERRLRARNARRKTPASYGNQRGTNKKKQPMRSAGKCYSVASYRRAVHRACLLAGVTQWSPNQLRHTAGTKIRQEYDLEAAQVVLGHSRAEVTEIYAERDLNKAKSVIREIG